uniref:Uncharacterized protein n=1 Tax=Oryza sativa subsp. japonica TaxID=39947 RepID=Q5VQ86_ORYSJ|nr:hypothetical protein [Oryza sativa Japonica Group]
MPGKGRRRREKNYRAAHGGEPRLPPPPKQRELDALPSKLRRLIAIQEKHKGGEKGAVAGDSSGKQGESDAAKNKALAKIRYCGLISWINTMKAKGSGRGGKLWIFVSDFIDAGALSSLLQGGSGAGRRLHVAGVALAAPRGVAFIYGAGAGASSSEMLARRRNRGREEGG